MSTYSNDNALINLLNMTRVCVDEGLMSSRERMRRDRELHRLGLAAVERFPHDVAISLLQDACIALELEDATRLPAALHRLLRVVAAVPRLERFVADVCQVGCTLPEARQCSCGTRGKRERERQRE
jgi:hypothetical protein